MTRAVLSCARLTATLIFLRLVFGGLSSLTLADILNPLHDNVILQVSNGNVMNVFQCQRLCWYRKPCVRYSFHTTNDNSVSAKSADNCVLHVTKESTQGQGEGWILEEASSKGMPPDHGCIPRPCSETEICVPYNGRVNYQCIPAPSPGWLESNCSDTCAWKLTDCYSGHCLCKAGYYFSRSQYACVTTCTTLQNNYLRYRLYDLRGHDVGDPKTTHDVTGCKSLCNAESWCLVFVFIHHKNRCFLKNVTAQDYPQDWVKLSTVDAYQRTCV